MFCLVYNVPLVYVMQKFITSINLKKTFYSNYTKMHKKIKLSINIFTQLSKSLEYIKNSRSTSI